VKHSCGTVGHVWASVLESRPGERIGAAHRGSVRDRATLLKAVSVLAR
jgi:hypothetical protein